MLPPVWKNVYPSTYNNTYIYIILLLYIPSHSPPYLFIRNQHPSLPHYSVHRNTCCTYPSPHNNVFTCSVLGSTTVTSCMENVYPPTYNNTYINIILLLYSWLTWPSSDIIPFGSRPFPRYSTPAH